MEKIIFFIDCLLNGQYIIRIAYTKNCLNKKSTIVDKVCYFNSVETCFRIIFNFAKEHDLVICRKQEEKMFVPHNVESYWVVYLKKKR